MKSAKRAAVTCALMLCCVLGMAQAQAGVVGLWEFEDAGDLTKATLGSDLALTGTQAAVPGSGGPDTGAAQVGDGDYYTAVNPIGANGGGSNTNAYTLLIDMNTPGQAWNALVDIDESVFASDGEVFTDAGGGLGIDGDYFGSVGGAWHRVVLVFDMASATPMTTYIDGVLNHSHTVAEMGGPPNAAVDGRWALLGTFDAFSDNGGSEEETLAVSNLALFDTALTGDQVTALGGPGRIIIPEPGTMILALLAAVGLAGITRRQTS